MNSSIYEIAVFPLITSSIVPTCLRAICVFHAATQARSDTATFVF